MFTAYSAIWRIRDKGQPEIYHPVRVTSRPDRHGYVEADYFRAAFGWPESTMVAVSELVGLDPIPDPHLVVTERRAE